MDIDYKQKNVEELAYIIIFVRNICMQVCNLMIQRSTICIYMPFGPMRERASILMLH